MPHPNINPFLPTWPGTKRPGGYGRTPDQISLTNLFATIRGRKFGDWVWETRTFTADAGTDELTTELDHHWGDDAGVRVSSSGTLPSPLAANTTYYVVDAELTSGLNEPLRTLKLSATKGGTAIDILDAGTGTHTIRRFNGYSEGDTISNPAYVIESLLRDELGFTSARIDVASFDGVGNTTDGTRKVGANSWAFSRSILDVEHSLDLIGSACQEACLVFYQNYKGKHSIQAIETSSTAATLTEQDFLLNEIGAPDIGRIRKTDLSAVRNAFRLNWKFNYATGGFDENLWMEDVDGDGVVEDNFSDSYTWTPPRGATYNDWLEESIISYGPGEEVWEFDALWIRDQFTAEAFLTSMAELLAFRRIKLEGARLVRNLTTLALEPFKDAVGVDLDVLPSTAQNAVPFRIARRNLPAFGLRTEPFITMDFTEVPGEVTGRLATIPVMYLEHEAPRY